MYARRRPPFWDDDDDAVEAIVLLRKGEESLPALQDVEALVEELNREPGRMLPGVKIDVLYDRTSLIGVTTETVQENLLVGMALVTVVLLMFLSNVRTAIIVAINVPLALLFAFAMLYLRGKSANLLSIGAVDFGIIVDSSVIMVENIYRHLQSGLQAERPIRERIVAARARFSAACCTLRRSWSARFAAVHNVRPGGTNLRSHGRHLCLCPGGRPVAGRDALAGALRAVARPHQAQPRQLRRPLAARELPPAVASLHASSLADVGGLLRA